MTDQELRDIVGGLAVAQAESAKAQAKTEAIMAELGLAQARTEAAQAKTDLRFEEMSKVVAKTSRKLTEVGIRLGSMGQNLGAVAESFFYNSLKKMPEIGGISFDRVTPNMVVGTKAESSEFDIVLTNGATIAIVEVKFVAHVNDLNQIETQIKTYRALFPEHKDYAIYGGIAGLTVQREVLAEAKNRGFFVLEQQGKVMSSATEGMRAH